MKPTCTHCGLPLDPFGVCPQVTPADAAIMTAPVYCAPKPHPEECSCERCRLTKSILAA